MIKHGRINERYVVTVLVCFLVFVGLFFGQDYFVPSDIGNRNIVSAQAANTIEPKLNFHVWRVFPAQKNGGVSKAIVSVDPKHFNNKDMIMLADRLNRHFINEERVEAGLLDDETTARLFSTGKVNYATYEKAERGRYFVDRADCKEYIEFSKQKRTERKKIVLDCKR